MTALVVATAGCAHQRPAAAATAPQLRLAVLLVEKYDPALTRDLEAALKGLSPPAHIQYVVPFVSLDVVQLSIECLDASNECFAAVGRSLGVERLVFVQVQERAARGRPMRVRVTMFDVERAVPMSAREQEFADDAAAVLRTPEVVTDLISGLPRGGKEEARRR